MPRGGPWVRTHPADDCVGLRSCFLGDPNKFQPHFSEAHGAIWPTWGLHYKGNESVMSQSMRMMQTQHLYRGGGPFKHTPEEQFVNVLKERKKKAMAAMPPVAAGIDLQLRITLFDPLASFKQREPPLGEFVELKPPVWRRVRVSAAVNLNTLHDRVLAPLFGWVRNYHGYYFTDVDRDGAVWCPIGESGSIDMMFVEMHVIEALDPKGTTLGEVLREPGARLAYTYDLGDLWQHLITLEAIITPEEGANGKTVVLDGAMRGPDEDGKGAGMYQEEVLDNFNLAKTGDKIAARKLEKECRKRASAANVLNGRFDPEEFSIEACQHAILSAAASRASAQEGSKMHYFPVQRHGVGVNCDFATPFQSSDPSSMFGNLHRGFFGAAAGKAVRVSSPTGMMETVNTKRDSAVDGVCAACGSPQGTGGKPLMRCSRCRCTWYCSRECQVSDWARHKKVCADEKQAQDQYRHNKK